MSAAGLRFRAFLAVLGNAPGADHLDVVVHQRACRRGVAHFDAWAANFAEAVTALELAPDFAEALVNRGGRHRG